ncbi:MAG: hypothetical protein GX102_01435 [Porphyromonadaceae bacterium]|jgi:hypothetical protein|nr:hypothetical protein [Porphyromonadaceae bacterium]
MIIAVDFDGTIVTHEYPKIGREIPFAIDTLKRIQNSGEHLLILWTVREGDLLEEAVEFCRSKGLEFYAVNSNYPEGEMIDGQPRKLNADLFIDDRNLGGIPDWGVIYRMVMSGKPHNPISTDFIPDSKPKKKGWFGR